MSFVNRILLVAVLLGTVALYLDTRDRWNWDRLTRAMIFALALFVGGAAGLIYWSSLPPTSPVSALWDIPLGAGKGDVRFLKGEPSEIVEPGTWLYAATRGSTYSVVFGEADEVTRVLAVSPPGYGSGAFLLGIRPGLGVQRLVDQLGEPSRVVPLSNDLRRAYLYSHLNAVFVLERGAVVSYGIYDVEAGDPYGEGEGEVGAALTRLP